MKISQKQASLLAKEVVNKLKKCSVVEISDEMVEKIKAFKKKQSDLRAIELKASEALEKHEDKFESIVGSIRGLYASDSAARIVQKIKEGNAPNVSEIEDKIILKSMFATDTDMESFISDIVKDFSKKKVSSPI